MSTGVIVVLALLLLVVFWPAPQCPRCGSRDTDTPDNGKTYICRDCWHDFDPISAAARKPTERK